MSNGGCGTDLIDLTLKGRPIRASSLDRCRSYLADNSQRQTQLKESPTLRYLEVEMNALNQVCN